MTLKPLIKIKPSKGSKGDTGETGATGAKGDKGDDGGIATDHSVLNNLDFANAGHTGFAAALTADQNYVSDAQLAALHGAISLDANADTLLSLSTQELGLDTQVANKIFGGPATGADAVPTFRDLVTADIPTLLATKIEIAEIGTATCDDVQDWLNTVQSAGIACGFTLSNSRNVLELDVAAGQGFVKSTDDCCGSTLSFDYAGTTNVTLTADNINYIYIDYNAGTPQVSATTDRTSIELNRHFILGRVYKNGTTLHILNAGVHIGNLTRTEHERLVERDGFDYISGAVTTETGTLELAVTAGVWYIGHNRITTGSLDTSVADTFRYTHYGTASWITDDATATAVDCTHYNDGDDVVGELGVNNYGTQWVYITTDSLLYVIYGTENGTLASAEDASPPASLPIYLDTMGELIAKIIVRQNGTIISIETTQETTFTTSGVANHNELGGLQGGQAAEYYHLTSAQHTVVGNTSGANTGDQDLSGKADVDQTMYIGTTGVAINRASAALTLAGLTLTTPNLGTPSAGTLTNCSFPTLNQNTSGTAANLSGTPALPNGTTATTQAAADNSTKLATTAYADAAAGGGGAATSLNNLAAVAINTSLTSDTDITDDLGTGDVRWKDIHAATLNAGLTATDTLKLRGRDVDGSAYVDILTITSANTVTADLNALVTIGGNAILYSGGDAGTPSALVGTNISGTASGLSIGGTAAVATGFTCSDNESEDLACPLVFVDGATGTQGAETDGDLTYTPLSGTLAATIFSGALTGNVTGDCSGSSGSCTGNSATVTNATLTTSLTVNTEVPRETAP